MNDQQTPEQPQQQCATISGAIPQDQNLQDATLQDAILQGAILQDTSEESEPFLGIWWTILMIVIYLLKELVAPEPYTAIWFIEMYILFLVVFVTLFTVYKRVVYFRRLKQKAAIGKNNS